MRLILSGGTRIVILTKHSAIKIARFRILRLLGRLIVLPFQAQRKHAKFRERYGSFPQCLWNYISIGLVANRNEYEYWQQTRDWRVGEIFKQSLKCGIIWQAAGHPVTLEELRREDPFSAVPERLRRDFRSNMEHQYAYIDGCVVLIDFGDAKTRRALEETFLFSK